MEHCKLNGIKRQRRLWRVSNAIKRVSTRPRLCVFRSLKNIYCQIIDDENAKTLASASTRDKGVLEAGVYGGNVAAAAIVGKLIAERALAAGVKSVAFDRRNYKYHGRVAALADAARDAGLDLGAKADPAEKAKKSAKGGKNVNRAAKKEAKAAKAGKPGK